MAETTKAEIQAIQKIVAKSGKEMGELNSMVNELIVDAHNASKSRTISDWILNAESKEIAKKIADTFLL